MIKPANGPYTQGFSSGHQAVDIDGKIGDPVFAPDAHTVGYVGQMGTGKNNAGLVVELGSPKTSGHRLCHLSKALVKKGDKVKPGQKIALIGNSGYVIPGPGGDGSHLHWICFINGKRVDGRKYVGAAPSPATKPAPKRKSYGTIRFGMWFVRKSPNGPIRPGVALGGQKYEILETVSGWRRVNFRGSSGWIGPKAWK